jgi:hypothetical protein
MVNGNDMKGESRLLRLKNTLMMSFFGLMIASDIPRGPVHFVCDVQRTYLESFKSMSS